MSENNVVEIKKRGTISADALTEMLKTGAQQLIHQAVQQLCLGLTIKTR